MATVNPYITFNGNCEEAFNMYKSIFGGEFASLSRFNEMPPQDGSQAMPPEAGEKIMHVSLPISKETVLMGSDTGGEWAADFAQGNNITLSIQADSIADADRIFAALSSGGQVTMPMAMTFWNSYFGMCKDKFGIYWMMSYDEKPGN